MAIGMSGGTDSSAAAAMLVDQGYEVIGLTAHMWKDGSRCCSLEDVERARKVCSYLDIRHYVVNAQDIFTDKIVDPFVEAYASGRTPSPCIYCNSFVKFGFLMDRALQLNCDHLATGHYACVQRWADGKYHLLAAQDANKDQSYFLHRLSQKQLAFLLFPLADLPKPAVKAYSEERGLPIVPRGESQDLCFVEEGKLPDFVERRDPSVIKRGEIRDPDGKVVGHHDGLHRFTVGQRGKLGIALGERMYVKRLDQENNVVEVAPRPGVMKSVCTLSDIHWISGEAPAGELVCEVRPRYRSNGATATVKVADGTVVFDEPQFALTPGQAAVFYQNGEVLGGGWIDEVP
ncbi:tRNA 2-thiouridine(34) synthase MnmA [Pontiella sp.]|uniref:tRNA 2-thiouridine(34) synthase MnmA n=1 Tax=Pontiella sp. TaxID=2837462 RepID=UPI003569A5DD